MGWIAPGLWSTAIISLCMFINWCCSAPEVAAATWNCLKLQQDTNPYWSHSIKVQTAKLRGVWGIYMECQEWDRLSRICLTPSAPAAHYCESSSQGEHAFDPGDFVTRGSQDRHHMVRWCHLPLVKLGKTRVLGFCNLSFCHILSSFQVLAQFFEFLLDVSGLGEEQLEGSFFRQVESQVGQVKLKMGIQTQTSATVRIGMHKKNIIGLLFKEEI